LLGLVTLLTESDNWRTLRGYLRHNLLVSGVSGSIKSLLASGLVVDQGRSLLFLTATSVQAEEVARDLQALLPDETVLSFPARENPLYGIAALSPELAAERLRVLDRLSRGERVAVVAAWEALTYRLPDPASFLAHSLQLTYGQVIAPEEVIRLLIQSGYERVDMVEHPGQFSQRGGILDVYGPTNDLPVRIEFFGDEIDLIREFDLTTQRSLQNLQQVTVLPAQEGFWPNEAAEAGLARLEQQLTQAATGDRQLADRRREHVGGDLARLREGLIFAGRERYLPFFQEEKFSLFDYLPADALVVIDEPSRIWEQATSEYQLFTESFTGLLTDGRVLAAQADVAFSPDELLARLPKQGCLHFAVFPRRPAPWKIERHLPLISRSVANLQGQIGLLRQEVSRMQGNGFAVVILASSAERQQHLQRYLEGEGFDPVLLLGPGEPPPAGKISLLVGDLAGGFELPELRLYVLTEGDILQRKRRRRRQLISPAEGARLSSYRDLAIGDYVVHVQHGVGQYLGIKTLEIDGLHRDYLQVKYAGEDRLYVPTDQIQLLQKYVGAEGKTPRIYSLGGGDWQRVKTRVKQSVREMAKELLALYAARASVPGYAFPPDGEWQDQMESNFPYRETDDQRRAIAEVKQDMERDQVMDRLLCGDVGYGKTEVAVRAAFKAAASGKQVAVLVPTTILAQQHYTTFCERFAGFPLEVAMLSRFRSAAENRETVRRVAQGLVDVVIGTHRLLQKDVKFHDLGLLVIDEEQRFGVADKEKLRQLRENVDTLTLSATPIPRTLHMAMVGMRDMSSIETPPEDRFPVQTYVMEQNDEVIRNAIRRELGRQGQVYYVHNRVRSINSVVERLAKLVPEARIAAGHGRMSEERLERLMLEFMEGEYDILVSTTIIESGLDIPNVNTMIVEDADKFGLAQLYQLRGRVGRSNRVAYAYFMYRPEKALSEVAEKRLQAIKEFTELGSGFKIALRDLEIRGAGNILGPEQHGFMIAVGFDLYCQLLEEAVRELKGQPLPEEFRTELQLSFDAYIPDRYIRDSMQKVEMYKKIQAAADLEDVDDLVDEMLDRYGRMPESVANLLLAARLRVLARRFRISSLTITDQQLTMTLAHDAFFAPADIEFLYRETNGRLRLQANKAGVFRWQLQNTSAISAARQWVDLMKQLRDIHASEQV
jgi:transcription-repair coupling factor (superfamily II helicase)